jgi:transposase
MARGKELPERLRNEIAAAHAGGDGYKKLAARFNVNTNTVKSILRKFKQHGTTTSLPRSGRPGKLSARSQRLIRQQVAQDPGITSKALQQSLVRCGTDVHRTTIRRTLNNMGMRSCIARKKPLLKKCHKTMRLRFANEQLKKSRDFWKSVLWTDETKIELFSQNEKRRVWRTPNSAFKEKNLCATVKHGGGSILLWGCFSAAGTGRLAQITGRMNSEMYQEILDENLAPSVRDLGLGRHWTFQQDNDPKHTSASTKRWFQSKRIRVMDWPSQSPDLNPIEMLWHDLKMAVHARKPSNLRELAAYCHEEWARISQDRCKRLVSSYRNRLLAVVAAKGGCTKY